MEEPSQDRLTGKQEQFCQEYIADPELNATRAAKKAGYSETSAAESASENLRKSNVQARISELMAARMKRCRVTQDDVVLELKRLGFSDMRNFTEWTGATVKAKDSSGLSEDDSRCVAEVSQTITKFGDTFSFKLHSKTKALELLARHLGMLVDHVDHTTKGKEIKPSPQIVVSSAIVAGELQEVIDREKANAKANDESL